MEARGAWRHKAPEGARRLEARGANDGVGGDVCAGRNASKNKYNDNDTDRDADEAKDQDKDNDKDAGKHKEKRKDTDKQGQDTLCSRHVC